MLKVVVAPLDDGMRDPTKRRTRKIGVAYKKELVDESRERERKRKRRGEIC